MTARNYTITISNTQSDNQITVEIRDNIKLNLKHGMTVDEFESPTLHAACRELRKTLFAWEAGEKSFPSTEGDK